MGLGRGVEVVGLVRVAHHAVGKGRIGGGGDDIRGHDHGLGHAAQRANVLGRHLPGQQGAAGHDRGEAVEETVLGLKVHVRGQSAVSGLRHVVRQGCR